VQAKAVAAVESDRELVYAWAWDGKQETL